MQEEIKNNQSSSSGSEDKSFKRQRRPTAHSNTPANHDSQEYVSIVNGKEVRVLKCRTCNIIRPPRSFHCSDCRACVEVHDHHCPWVGTCVGKRNHRYFFLFTLLTTVHSVYTLFLNVMFQKKELYGEEDDDKWNQYHAMSLALLIFCSLITCCVGCLAGYHGKLAFDGVTTNEEIRGKFSNGNQNPYDEGCGGNCRNFWYGGTSRIYSDQPYDIEAISKIEPNVFVIKPYVNPNTQLNQN